jgi:hypothetical protein
MRRIGVLMPFTADQGGDYDDPDRLRKRRRPG